jgi:type IV pilus assembly protein PilC
LLASGVPLVKGLEALTVQPENPHFGEIVEDCTLLVSSGSRLSAALATYPKIFPSVFVSMCQIGEETGQLDSVLSQLATWMEKDIAVRQRVKSALSYPTLVLCVSFGLGLLVFYKVMPGFISVFKDMNVPLPFITKLVMAVSTSMQSWLFWVLLVAGLFVGQRLLAQVMDSLEGRARAVCGDVAPADFGTDAAERQHGPVLRHRQSDAVFGDEVSPRLSLKRQDLR